MTLNSRESAARGARLRGPGCDAAAWPPAAAAAEPTTRFHAEPGDRFRRRIEPASSTRATTNGSKFSVNATVSDTDQTIVCGSNALWSQSVAALYGLVFPHATRRPPRCSRRPSRIRAAFGARATDLGAQIDAQQADSPLGAGDLVDGADRRERRPRRVPAVPGVRAKSSSSPTSRPQAPRSAARSTASPTLGAKVLLSTIFDVGFSPFATAERAAHADTDRAAC